MAAESYLVDTNILLRLLVLKDKESAVCQRSVVALRRRNIPLHFTLQNASEFWNVCTRPLERNGLAMEPSQAAHALQVLLAQFTVLPDTTTVFTTWMELVSRYDVRGVQVHDAKLVASMKAHDIHSLLKLNDKDINRFDVEVARPDQITE